MPKLILKKGDLIVKKLSVSEDILAFTIGSEPGNDIIIKDERVSFFHMQFEKQGSDYYVRDLQSQNGTYVNGSRIISRTQIKNHSEIGIGEHKITVLLPEAAPSPALSFENYEQNETPHSNMSDKISGVPSLVNLNSSLTENHEIRIEQSDLLDRPPKPQKQIPENNFPANGKSYSLDNMDELLKEEENKFLNPKPETYATPLLPFDRAPAPTSTEAELSYMGLDENSIMMQEPGSNVQFKSKTFYLLGIHGYYLGRKFKVRKSHTRIGRDKYLNDIVIKRNSGGDLDHSISRRHATITFKKNGYKIRDKRSKTRTKVNQYEILPNEEVQLKPGDEIEIVSDKKNHIFRFVEDGNWDFGSPKKVGNWFMRNRALLSNVGSILVITLAAIFLTKSFFARHYATANESLKITSTTWYDGGSKGRSNGNGHAAFNFPAIGDFNRDKFVDLAYINPQGFLTAIDGKTKLPLWENKEFKALSSIPVTVEDMFNDGYPDVIVVSEDLRLRAIDGRWGIEIWKSPILQGPLSGPPVINDFNGDGLKDMAIASLENRIYIGYADLKKPRWSQIEIGETINSIIATSNATKVGQPDILLGTESGTLLSFDGIRRTVSLRIDVNKELSKASGKFEINQIRSPIAVGRLNQDDVADLLISTVQGNLLAIDGMTGKRMWFDLVNEKARDKNLRTPILGDLDGDKLDDVVTITPAGKVRALKGKGRGKDRVALLWEHGGRSQKESYQQLALADFNKNGTMDVVATNNKGKMTIFEGATGAILWETETGIPTSGAPLIADFDGDDYLDILVQQLDGRFVKFSTNSLIPTGSVIWGQIYGNSRNTNIAAQTIPSPTQYTLYMVISLIVILSVIGFNIITRIRNSNLSNLASARIPFKRYSTL